MGTGLHPHRKAFLRHEQLWQDPYPGAYGPDRTPHRKDVPEVHRQDRKRPRPDPQGLLGEFGEIGLLGSAGNHYS